MQKNKIRYIVTIYCEYTKITHTHLEKNCVPLSTQGRLELDTFPR